MLWNINLLFLCKTPSSDKVVTEAVIRFLQNNGTPANCKERVSVLEFTYNQIYLQGMF